jgi:AraC family transcriptional regulator
MSLVLDGTFRERMGNATETLRPLSVSLMPSGVPHDDVFGPTGARLLTVSFSGALEREMIECTRMLSTWRWIHGGPVVRAFVNLLRGVRGAAMPNVIEVLIVDAMVAASATSTARAAGGPPRWLQQVRAAIDDGRGWPKVSELATLAGVHRVYLARQFKRFYGCTVSTYVRRRCLQSAANDIAKSRALLSTIACDHGFSDEAHLCRTFRDETGLTPSAFRALTGRFHRFNRSSAAST